MGDIPIHRLLPLGSLSAVAATRSCGQVQDLVDDPVLEDVVTGGPDPGTLSVAKPVHVRSDEFVGIGGVLLDEVAQIRDGVGATVRLRIESSYGAKQIADSSYQVQPAAQR
jgi:hypothetical protein